MTTIQKKSLNVGKFVKTAHVDAVIRNYKKERWVHNSARLGREDSLSVWYSVEELESLLGTIKQHGGDGVKLYFGAYPLDYAENPAYAGRQTIVLVATKSRETTGGTTNKDIYITKEGASEILAYNAGRICPPFCGGGGNIDGDSEWGALGLTLVKQGDAGLLVV